MSYSGCSLRVIKECYPFILGEQVYCIEDSNTRQIIRVGTRREIFGVNEVIVPYAKLCCFKIII